jgi:hypothetical protein
MNIAAVTMKTSRLAVRESATRGVSAGISHSGGHDDEKYSTFCHTDTEKFVARGK